MTCNFSTYCCEMFGKLPLSIFFWIGCYATNKAEVWFSRDMIGWLLFSTFLQCSPTHLCQNTFAVVSISKSSPDPNAAQHVNCCMASHSTRRIDQRRRNLPGKVI